jgi:hypothetical protein
MTRTSTTVLGAALVFVLACGPSKTEQRHQRELAEATSSGKAKTAATVGNLRQGRFDLRYYEDVTVGMDLAMVTAYLGASGREISTATEAGKTTAVHEWSGTGGAISVTFVDGAVTSKSKRED